MDNISFEKIWNTLSVIDCKGHTDKKICGKDKFGNAIRLDYLSWTWAWGITMKHFPNATYTVREWEGRPYMNDPIAGVMVMTTVNIGGNERTMWLAVMDGSNTALKDHEYVVHGYKDRTISQVDMCAINKAIMRCLVKNLAMFGLGLHIYAGEDLPVGIEDDDAKNEVTKVQTAQANPAKPSAESLAKPAPAVTKKILRAKPNPRAAAAWTSFKALDQVKSMGEDDRKKAWENLLFTSTGKTGAAQITDDSDWDKVDNEISVMSAI